MVSMMPAPRWGPARVKWFLMLPTDVLFSLLERGWPETKEKPWETPLMFLGPLVAPGGKKPA